MTLHRSLLGIVSSCVLMTSAAMAQTSGEQLLFSPPTGWIKAFDGKETTVSLSLYTPPGQSAESWAEAVVVRVHNGMTITPPDVFLSTIPTQLEESCPQLRASKAQKGQVNGYTAAFQFLECPVNTQSNRGEVVMSLAIQGKDALYVIQRAWQVDPFPNAQTPPVPQQTLDSAVAYLHAVKLCNSTAPQAHPCR